MAGLLNMTPLDDPGLAELPMSAFDAARVSRRDPSFLPQGLGPNAEAEQFGGLERIWARSTHLHDNNEIVDAAAEAEIDRVVGTGIDDLEPDTGWTDVDDAIAALYEWAFQAVDPERSMCLAEVQALYIRERRRTGECGVRIVMAEAWGGYPAMPAIELIEAERIPPTLTGINPANGNPVRQGVEYDAQWRIVAYHVLTANPRDGDPKYLGMAGSMFFGGVGFGSPFLTRVPAGEMTLRMSKRRIRQLRGVPGLVSAMRTIRTEDEYVDTSMTHARTAASVGVLMPASSAAMFKPKNGVTPLLVDGMGNPISTISGGAVGFYQPNPQVNGAGVETMHANLPGPQFEPTVRGLQRRTSRGLNGPYSQISGDYSQETFASNRANRIDQRQRDVRHQEMHVVRPVNRAFCRVLVQWGILSGRVKLRPEHVKELAVNPEILYRTNVPQPGEAYVNPAQEATATATDLASGVASEIEKINTRGGSWKRTLRQRVKFRAEFVRLWNEAGLSGEPPMGGAPGGSGGAANPEEDDKPGKDGGDAEAVSEADQAADEVIGLCRRSGIDPAALVASLQAGLNGGDMHADRARRNGVHHLNGAKR